MLTVGGSSITMPNLNERRFSDSACLAANGRKWVVTDKGLTKAPIPLRRLVFGEWGGHI